MAAPNPGNQPNPPQGEQFYPPPPPGPPPAQQTGQNQPHYPPPPAGGPPHPLQSHPPSGQTANYPTIPAYDPAHPQFAPPPAQPQFAPPPANLAAEDRPPVTPTDPHSNPTTPSKAHGGWSDRLHQIGRSAADPINALAHKMGSQSFLPMTLDKECEKAAAILSSFCKDGVEEAPPVADTHTTSSTHDKLSAQPEKPRRNSRSNKALLKIPPSVIQSAHGLAIFTVARVGFQISGATGSGIVVARRPDGAWSPPSGIQVHSLGAGFMVGADIYDCVCVLNSKEALDAFMNTRVSLGSDLAVAAGPYGAGGNFAFGRATATEKPDGINRHGESNTPVPPTGAPAAGTAPVDDGRLKADGKPAHKRSTSKGSLKPVFSYVKSRGLYAGISVDGTVITERKEANAAFYGQPVTVEAILDARVPDRWASIKSLGLALSAAQTLKPGDVSETTTFVPGTTQPGAQPPLAQGQPQTVPGAVSVPVERYDQPAGSGAYGAGVAPGAGVAHGAHGAPGAGVAPGAAPPGYVDDGRPYPGTGDQKIAYQ